MAGERDLHQRGLSWSVDVHPIDSAAEQAQEYRLSRAVIGDSGEDLLVRSARCERGRLTEMRDQNVDLVHRARQPQFVLAAEPDYRRARTSPRDMARPARTGRGLGPTRR